jgi:hypothetical protein
LFLGIVGFNVQVVERYELEAISTEQVKLADFIQTAPYTFAILPFDQYLELLC